MAGIERGPQTMGPGRQDLPKQEAGDMPGTPFEETEDAERLAKLPEHERDNNDRPIEGGLVGGGAAGIAAGIVAGADEKRTDEEADEAADKDVTDRRG
jgi:hypothetical protein